MIITDCGLPEKLRAFAIEHDIPIINIKSILQEENKKELVLGEFDSGDIAYIMFTSGSTGEPKGVPVTHNNYINFVRNALEILPFQRREVFSDFHDLGFDISVFYLFCAVLTESALAPILRNEHRFFPLDNIVNNSITVWSSVPSVVARIMMLRPKERIDTSLKIVFMCGEPFRLDILKYCYDNMQIKNVYNFYGLTETGVENFYHHCKPSDMQRFDKFGYVPIGKPLKGNTVKITKDKELLISGSQITPGYLKGMGRDRFENVDGKTWFHTGDIVEKYEDVYFCKGRLDTQVKVSGYRVELMDIEIQIKKYSTLQEAICFVDNNKDQNRLICAVQPEEGKEVDFTKLLNEINDELPEYMIPKKFFTIDKMPTNKNGKIDRKAIRKLYSEIKSDTINESR
jgi:acyl-coenzyme A synthetase/AMP-(fatty) acid ligase